MRNYRDPRLADPVLLALAGRRVLHRQAQPPLPSWEQTDGLAALLAYAARLPQRDPQDLALEEGGPFGTLLRQARQWDKEHGHGA
jgi:hypothetical protein